MSAHEERSTARSEPNAAERMAEPARNSVLTCDLIEQRFKVNVESLHAQTFTLTQVMDTLIKDNSVRTYPTVATRNC